jgi:hypothetical protein
MFLAPFESVPGPAKFVVMRDPVLGQPPAAPRESSGPGDITILTPVSTKDGAQRYPAPFGIQEQQGSVNA